MPIPEDALQALRDTSRTFFEPILRLPLGLQEAVAAAYLCMRAIDEIEDHPILTNVEKAALLRQVSLSLQAGPREAARALAAKQNELPEVTRRLADWLALAPAAIGPRILDAIAAMAERMAHWAEISWRVRSEADLDQYTYGVAGAVGLLLSDLWAWFAGIQTDRPLAVAFGRGLQAVNILRNRKDDLARGVDLYPDEWDDDHMHAYARRHLALADAYLEDLPPGPIHDSCRIPLALAYATLDALADGRPKLTRQEVQEILQGVAPPAD
ncbi:MAG: squalene/phytoene synthase family protein [Anaerolineales bacterium]